MGSEEMSLLRPTPATATTATTTTTTTPTPTTTTTTTTSSVEDVMGRPPIHPTAMFPTTLPLPLSRPLNMSRSTSSGPPTPTPSCPWFNPTTLSCPLPTRMLPPVAAVHGPTTTKLPRSPQPTQSTLTSSPTTQKMSAFSMVRGVSAPISTSPSTSPTTSIASSTTSSISTTPTSTSASTLPFIKQERQIPDPVHVMPTPTPTIPMSMPTSPMMPTTGLRSPMTPRTMLSSFPTSTSTPTPTPPNTMMSPIQFPSPSFPTFPTFTSPTLPFPELSPIDTMRLLQQWQSLTQPTFPILPITSSQSVQPMTMQQPGNSPSEMGKIRPRNKRRKIAEIHENELWRCPFYPYCDKVYKRTSTLSIRHHRAFCTNRPDHLMNHDKDEGEIDKYKDDTMIKREFNQDHNIHIKHEKQQHHTEHDSSSEDDTESELSQPSSKTTQQRTKRSPSRSPSVDTSPPSLELPLAEPIDDEMKPVKKARADINTITTNTTTTSIAPATIVSHTLPTMAPIPISAPIATPSTISTPSPPPGSDLWRCSSCSLTFPSTSNLIPLHISSCSHQQQLMEISKSLQSSSSITQQQMITQQLKIQYQQLKALSEKMSQAIQQGTYHQHGAGAGAGAGATTQPLTHVHGTAATQPPESMAGLLSATTSSSSSTHSPMSRIVTSSNDAMSSTIPSSSPSSSSSSASSSSVIPPSASPLSSHLLPTSLSPAQLSMLMQLFPFYQQATLGRPFTAPLPTTTFPPKSLLSSPSTFTSSLQSQLSISSNNHHPSNISHPTGS